MSRHTYECHVRFSDVDVYGHVNNVKYFEYYQEARIAFILTLAGGLFDGDSSNRQVVARIGVDYKRPILFRAEPYAVETWVTRIGTSFVIFTVVIGFAMAAVSYALVESPCREALRRWEKRDKRTEVVDAHVQGKLPDVLAGGQPGRL